MISMWIGWTIKNGCFVNNNINVRILAKFVGSFYECPNCQTFYSCPVYTPSGAWNWKFFDKNIWPAVCWLAIWIRKVFKKEVLISPHWSVTRASMIGMLRINKIGEISKLDPNVGECIKNRYSKFFWTIFDTFWRFGHFYRFIFYFLLSIYYHHLNFESI